MYIETWCSFVIRHDIALNLNTLDPSSWRRIWFQEVFLCGIQRWSTELGHNHTPLQRRHGEPNDISHHQRLDCLLNRLFRRRSTKTSKLPVTGLCAGNSTVTGEFPAQRTSNAEIFSFDDVIMQWWHDIGWSSWFSNVKVNPPGDPLSFVMGIPIAVRLQTHTYTHI